MTVKTKADFKIRTRIMLLYLGLSLLLISIAIPGMFYLISKTLKDSFDSVIKETMNQAESCIVLEEEGIALSNIKDLEEKLLRNGGLFVKIYDENYNELFSSHGASDAFEWCEKEKNWKKENRTIQIHNEQAHIFLVGNVYYNSLLQNLLIVVLLFIPIYLILTAIFTYFMAKTMLNPISKIISTTRTIKAGDWKKRIEDINTKDEIGELAQEFNEMISTIDESYTRERSFTSNASHELRTPVSIIKACSEEALTTNDQQIVKENLETIQFESDRIGKIISQLLILSRGFEGRYNFNPEPLELFECTESIIGTLEEESSKKNITIHNEIEKDRTVCADQIMLTQILINVIGNAIKYGRQNGNIWAHSYSMNNYIWIEIKDDGSGIAQEDLTHIFERFYRGDKTRNRDGVGLGLSIVKWIIDLHHGKIQVSSTIDKGTTFLIGFPQK